MSQAMSNTYGYGSESMAADSKPEVSKGTIAIPYEAIRGMADQSLVAQVDELKRMLAEAQQNILKKDETIREQRDALGDMSLELHKIKKENERLYQQIQEKGEATSDDDFCLVCDPRKYADNRGNHPPIKWVHNFWNVLFTHSLGTLENGAYYIENSTSIAVIYKLVHDSNRIAFKFTGSYDDFCYSWNANIADRIKDKERASMLTSVGTSLKSEYNKKHWKDVSIGKLETNPDINGVHGKIYSKANIIITHVMSDLKDLTA